MKISRVSVLREFDVPERSTAERPIQLFDSYGVDPAGRQTRFARYLETLDRQWDRSFVVQGDKTIIGSGEDPRTFYWRGSVCLSSQCYTPDHQYVNRLYIVRDRRWITLIPPKSVIPGKNWTPFVYDNDLFFVHQFSPFRIFKARALTEHDGHMLLDIVAEHPVKVPNVGDKFARLRGGSCGVQVGEMVVGVGHTNDPVKNQKNHLEHRPFFFVYVPGQRVTYYSFEYPFTNEYCIVDPTSLYLEDGKLMLVTCETEITWNWPQTGRICLYKIDFQGAITESAFENNCQRWYGWDADQRTGWTRLFGR